MSLKHWMQARLLAQTARTLRWECVKNYLHYRASARRVTLDAAGVAPIMFATTVTRRCNLNCSWCVSALVEKNDEWKAYEATVATMERLLDHPAVRKALYVQLTGGEPVLCEALPAIISLVRKKGHMVGMTSNGLLLGEAIRELKTSGINSISVSLYDNTLQRLERILPEVNAHFRVRTGKIILKRDLEDHPDRIEAAIRLAKDSGCIGTVLLLYLPGGGEDSSQIVFDDNPAFLDFKRRIQARFPGYAISWPQPPSRDQQLQVKRCRSLWYLVLADQLGNLGLCCTHYPDPKGRFGNLFEGEASAPLNTPLKVDMRKQLLCKGARAPGLCAGCYVLDDPWASDY